MKFLYIETKEDINNLIPIIFNIFEEQLQVIKYQTNDKSLTIFYQYSNIDINEAFTLLASELYLDFLVYESINYQNEVDALSSLETFLKVKEQFLLKNKYYNNHLLLEEYYKKVNVNLKKLILGKYYYDLEMKKNIITFLNCNQNVSLAAKELYLHRNTLNMRLNKFNEQTNFDLKQFRDAFLIYHTID